MNIFISYSSKDRVKVEELANDLRQLGYTIWFDHELSRTGGQKWWANILAQIRACDLFAFALSENSLISVPCQREYTYAYALRKRILPILLTDVDIPTLPYELQEIQFAPYQQRNLQQGLALAGSLQTLPPARDMPDPLPPEPEAPINPEARIQSQNQARLAQMQAQLDALMLSKDEQIKLYFDLETLFQSPATRAGADALLRRLYARDDLVMQVGDRIRARLADSMAESVTDSKERRPARVERKSAPTSARTLPMRSLAALAIIGVVLAVGGLLLRQAISRSGTPTPASPTAIGAAPTTPATLTPRPTTSTATLSPTLGPPTLTPVPPTFTFTPSVTPSITLTPKPPALTPRIFNVGLAVYSVAFSPDGSKILTGSGDNTAILWDAQTGTKLHTFSGHTDVVESVAFSPDGSKVLTGSYDTTAILWDVQTGAKLQTFSGHTNSVTSVAFSPDGSKVLTGSYDKTAILWDVQTGDELHTFTGHTDIVTSVAFSSDGGKILTGSADTTAILWNAHTGAKLSTFTGHTGIVTSVAFSPDGSKILTGSADNTAILWDAQTGADQYTFSGHTNFVMSVAFSPDGNKVLTGSGDKTAILWDVLMGTQLQTFTGHTNGVISVAFSPDGKYVLTGSADWTARLWAVVQ